MILFCFCRLGFFNCSALCLPLMEMSFAGTCSAEAEEGGFVGYGGIPARRR
jgi:hypothetical protein